MIADHYQAMLSFYGEMLGVRVSRKHLGWYMDSPFPLRCCDNYDGNDFQEPC